ncbi:GNAT family protein [Kitasatospora indigofera]|uniref:hypothetical protein n=1 Tax=Kitasatospora indigofera TaxID=67307 RepID=UPI003689C9C5
MPPRTRPGHPAAPYRPGVRTAEGGYGFDTLGLSEVHATVAAPNLASPALLGRIGFERVRNVIEEDGGTTHVLTRRPARAAPGPRG